MRLHKREYDRILGRNRPRDVFRGIHPRAGRLEEVDADNDRGRKIRQPRPAQTFNEPEPDKELG